jgi:hypothetical protein
MEPTVTISLLQYEQMKTELEHLRKVKESRICLRGVKSYSVKEQPYIRRISEESWEYFIDKDSLPDVSKELAEQLEEYKRGYERSHYTATQHINKYTDSLDEILDLKEKLKECEAKSVTKKKNWFWF